MAKRELNTPGAEAAREAAKEAAFKQSMREQSNALKQVSVQANNQDFEGVGDDGPGMALIGGRLSNFTSALGLAKAGALAGRTGLEKEVLTIPDASFNGLRLGETADAYAFDVKTPGARQRFVSNMLPNAPVVAKSARKQRLNDVRRDRPGLVGNPENPDKDVPLNVRQRRTVTE